MDTGDDQAAKDTEEDTSSFTRELEVGDKVVKIKQLYVGDVGCVVWDAALVLCKFLENEHFFPAHTTSKSDRLSECEATSVPQQSATLDGGVAASYWTGKRVIDLGSGTGAVGIAAAVLGADVMVTDLPEFVELMSANVDLNREVIQGSAIAKALTWGQDVSSFLPRPDFVLMADVVYYEESLVDLVKTLIDLCGDTSTIIMSYEQRTTGNKPNIEKKFFKMMETSNFHKTVISYDKLDPTYRSRDIHVVMFTRHVDYGECA